MIKVSKDFGKTCVVEISQGEDSAIHSEVRDCFMKATLVPIEGEGQRIVLIRSVNVIGRSTACDIQIDHESLSRRHAVLVVTDGLVVVRDMITTNGTRVNGQRVKWAALMPNDRVSFGAVRYRIELAPDSGPQSFVSGKTGTGAVKSRTELFGTPESLMPEPPPVESDDDDFRGIDDNQNTEIGGWRPPV